TRARSCLTTSANAFGRSAAYMSTPLPASPRDDVVVGDDELGVDAPGVAALFVSPTLAHAGNENTATQHMLATTEVCRRTIRRIAERPRWTRGSVWRRIQPGRRGGAARVQCAC